MIKAVIFDLDGVLVETDKWHFSALNIALQSVGEEPLSWKEHLEIYKGRPTAQKLVMMHERRNLSPELFDEIKRVKNHYTVDMIQRFSEPDPEKIEMMKLLKARGLQISVASNAITESVRMMLEAAGLLPYIDSFFGNETGEPKPAPDIYLHAFKQLDVAPHEVVIVEDSDVGRQAAKASKAFCCFVQNQFEVNYYRVLAVILAAEQPQVVIPAAGQGKRFYEEGYQHPKPLIDVQGRPMISAVIDDFHPLQAKQVVLMQQKHIEQYAANEIFDYLYPGTTLVPVEGLTEGAACTIMLAESHLRPESELIIANSDQKVDVDMLQFIQDMRDQHADGGIMTFQDTNPKWSFAKTDNTGRVIEVAEKNPISDQATVGIYYWRRAKDFMDCAREMIRKDIRTNGEFYVCPVFNEFIAQDGDIRIWEINKDQMHGLGTPEDLQVFLQQTS